MISVKNKKSPQCGAFTFTFRCTLFRINIWTIFPLVLLRVFRFLGRQST